MPALPANQGKILQSHKGKPRVGWSSLMILKSSKTYISFSYLTIPAPVK